MYDTNESPLCLGISATTGMPLPNVTAEALAAMTEREGKPDPERNILERRASSAGPSFGVVSDIPDPNDLAATGWGLVLARDGDPAIMEALKPLIEHRKTQAGSLFKLFQGPKAPAPDEPATNWITRNGATLDVVDPHKGIPYYLLLVGSPESIPFEFQYTLDIYWAVGRLYFDRVEDYARYAEGVVAYETAVAVKTARDVTLFATRHAFDAATSLFAKHVATVLADTTGPYGAVGSQQGFALRPCVGAEATKDSLTRILTGEAHGRLPAVLFSGSHGMEFDLGDPRQLEAQGALMCQDWPGFGAKSEDHWFAASDLPAGADLSGLIHFGFACYSGSCPREDNYARTAARPQQIAPHPMIARLPQAMLAHPGGSALAFLGHVDRAFAYSFQSERGSGQVQGMRDVLTRILRGDRIGNATDQMNIRWAALSTDLSETLEDRKYGAEIDDEVLKNRWIARDDARNYVILGDPAAQLRLDAMAA